METILIVEDEEDIAQLLAMNLAGEGYETHIAATGGQAFDDAVRLRPDLVLLDLMLPGVDGVDICRQLRQDPRTASTSIIILTARSLPGDHILGLEAGADDYVDKPFDLAYLKRAVAMALQTENAVRADRQSYVMAWSGLEYLTVPQWRTAFETADVIFGIDVATGQEILVFSRDALQMIVVKEANDGLRVLRISIDRTGDELELLVAACEAYRGHHVYQAEA